MSLTPSPKDKLNKIIPVETKNLSSSYYKDYTLLENLLHELQRFLNFFRVITNYMAINYLNKRNNLIVTKETESFKPTLNLENALYTVLEEFDLDSNETSFLMNDVQIRSKLKKPVSNKSKNKEKAPKNYDFDQSFHIMGCKIVTLIDSINHDTKTKPYIYTIPYTPEIVLLAMTQSCKVIGISATATIPTVIDNFDLGYIKSKLKNNFHSLNEEQKEIQKHKFEESIKNYKNPDGTDRIKIHTKIIDHPQSYDSSIWKNLFNDIEDEAKRNSLAQILDNVLKESYSKNNISLDPKKHADNGISEVLEPSVLNENQYNPEFISLVQAFKNRLTNPNTGEDIEKFENETSDKSKKSNIEIKILLNNIFNKNHPTFIKEIYIKRWQKLREFLLKYPTINENEIINITDNNIASSLYTKFAKPINAYSFSQTGDFEDTYVFLDKNQNDTTKLSAESSGLTKLMQIPGLKNHFINQGYATDFIPKNMIMTPPLFISIYKGALGEAAGKYILESLIVNQGKHLQLEEMPPEHYELFDFKVSEKQAYIDFKNWSNFTPKDRRN